MDFEKWNDVLARRLFRGSGLPVRFPSDDDELQKLSDELGCGLGDARSDLEAAVQEYFRLASGADPFNYLKQLGSAWFSQPCGPPPYLPVLAMAVLVANDQTERGQTSFYPPFSRSLGLSRTVKWDEYDSSVRRWWYQLGRYLLDASDKEPAQSAALEGLPTWMNIPTSGRGSTMGHAFTQVLLKRDDRHDVDVFLGTLDGSPFGELEIKDAEDAAERLVGKFRRWAGQEGRVTPRLQKLLAKDNDETLRRLGFLLLNRLLEPPGGPDDEPPDVAPKLRAVITLDDFDNKLGLGVQAPSNLAEGSQLAIRLEDEELVLYPDSIEPLPIDINVSLLQRGREIACEDGAAIEYRAQPITALATRYWDIWCAVDDVRAGEEIYVLAREDLAHRVASCFGTDQQNTRVALPEGWCLVGPAAPTSNAVFDEVTSLLKPRQPVVPRFSGGLPLGKGRTYLLGGAPDVRLTDDDDADSVLVDQRPAGLAARDGLVRLRDLDLSTGSHEVRVGPYSLRFELLPPGLPPRPETHLRSALSADVPTLDSDSPGFWGATVRPVVASAWNALPDGSRFLLLDDRGRCTSVDPQQAAWTESIELTPHVIEPLARSTYPDACRPQGRFEWAVCIRSGIAHALPMPSSPSAASVVGDALTDETLRLLRHAEVSGAQNQVKWRRYLEHIGALHD
jgi:hypothetical protein